MAHRVIWTWLKGPIPDGMQINHKDLNKQNNRIDNLEVVTADENIQHSYDNGRPKPWNKAESWRGKDRVTDEQRLEMVRLRQSGMKLREIAEKFAISVTHTQRIVACQK